MNLIVPSRRGFITGLASLMAALAIVRASSLMPVKALDYDQEILDLLAARIKNAHRIMKEDIYTMIYGDPALPTLTFRGINIEFDPVCPPDKFYIVPRRK